MLIAIRRMKLRYNRMQLIITIYGEDVPIEMHPKIRSDEAYYKSSSMAIELAKNTILDYSLVC